MKAYGITHRGRVRKENQDAFRLKLPEDGGVLTAVLCDGMGGARAGGLASSIAVEAFLSRATQDLNAQSASSDLQAAMSQAVDFANDSVYDQASEDINCTGMGTTLVALLTTGTNTMIANVGDSRAYMFYRNRLRQVTRDHSLVEDLVARGRITREQARTHPRRNIITRAIGVDRTVRADFTEVSFPEESRFLLCSDGLSNAVADEEIQDTLRSYADPETACNVLLNQALANGAPDNVTVLVVQH